MILARIPKRELPMWHLKVISGDILMRRRPNWGVSRKWEGNYLTQVGGSGGNGHDGRNFRLS